LKKCVSLVVDKYYTEMHGQRNTKFYLFIRFLILWFLTSWGSVMPLSSWWSRYSCFKCYFTTPSVANFI